MAPTYSMLDLRVAGHFLLYQDVGRLSIFWNLLEEIFVELSGNLVHQRCRWRLRLNGWYSTAICLIKALLS